MQVTRRRLASLSLAFALTASLPSIVSAAQTRPVNVTIDASKTGPPIPTYIYGQFLEHGGNIVNEGVWAEMLEDRKFNYPITSKLVVPPFSVNIYSFPVR